MLRFIKLLSFALIILSGTTFAQVKITKGTPYPVTDVGLYGARYYLSVGDKVFSLKIVPGITSATQPKQFLQEFSGSSLTLTKRIALDGDQGLVRMQKMGNRVYLTSSKWGKPQFYVQEFDINKNQLGDPKNVFTSPEKPEAGFEVFFSPDSTFMGVQCLMKSESKDQKIGDVSICVFNRDMTEKWRGTVTLPYKNRKGQFIDYSLDVDGNAYFLARVFNDDSEKESRSGKLNYTIDIIRVDQTTKKVTTATINFGGKFIPEVLLTPLASGEVICAGFYSLTDEFKNVDGIVAAKIGRDGKISNVYSYEIPLDILNQNETKEIIAANMKNKAISFRLIGVYMQSDGSALIVGEKYIWDPDRMSYESILVTKIGVDGKLLWMKKLPKRTAWSEGSFVYHKRNSKHEFYFLDHEKNANLTATDVPKYHVPGEGGFMTCYSVDDKTGDVKKQTLFNSLNLEGQELFQFTIKRILFTSTNSFVLETYNKKNEDVLIRVDLPD